MHFGLTDEQRLIVDTTRSFVEQELYPHEAEVERTGTLRREVIEEVRPRPSPPASTPPTSPRSSAARASIP